MAPTIGSYYNPSQQAESAKERSGLMANNQRSIELAAKIADDYKNNKIPVEQFNAALGELGVSIRDLDQYQRNYQATQTENRGTLGENPLLSNLVQNATARDASQKATVDTLATEIAANPLTQYNADASIKRQMALNNQANLATNVRDQLTNLQAARNTNAGLIQGALQGGAGFQNYSNPGVGR